MPNVRNQMKKLMMATVADEALRHDWTYSQFRPRTVPSAWKAGDHVIADCSKAVQMLSRWSGAPDPMGESFGPYGNSQTIWSHLQHAAAADELEVGDIITFGRDGDEHAAMVLEPGADPLLWSFGHQGAPNTYRLSDDRRERQFCKLPVVAYKPTPAEVLRAKTGWFSWVAWRLGEGDWKHFGPKAGGVRPDVPKVIPAGWWLRLGKFVANRKKGNKSKPRAQ